MVAVGAVGAAAVQIGNPGHVAVVEAVNGSKIRVSEYNKNRLGTYDNTRTGTPAQLGFSKFVHFEAFEVLDKTSATNKVMPRCRPGKRALILCAPLRCSAALPPEKRDVCRGPRG